MKNMHASEYPQVNERLRQARLKRGWRQVEVAEQLGTTAISMKRWEHGRQPGAYFRVKLCMLFGMSAEELGLSSADAPLADAAGPEALTPTASAQQALKVQAANRRAEEASAPVEHALWTIPYPRNPYFTGRDLLLEQLARQLSIRPSGDAPVPCRAALTQTQAIKGLGGIGKTQVAVEYAYRARAQGMYTHILWINAASEEAILTSFLALSDRLPAFPAQEEKDQRRLVAAVKRWLEQCPVTWLLIFDNADDLSFAQAYFPLVGRGSLLLTTRASAVGSFASPLEVETMGLVEGTTFLLHRAQRLQADDAERNEATNIVIALDGFPLALDQAGAYIEETECSFVDYLQLYQAHRRLLLARRGQEVVAYPASVATTWSLSFQQVQQANPAAAELLYLCAFLASDHIPEELLVEGAAHWPPLLQEAAASSLLFNRMLEDLLAFSLVKRFAEERLLRIHRLVQAVQIEALSLEEQAGWATRVIEAAEAIFPRDPRDEVSTWPLCLRYLETAQVCSTLIQQYQLLLPAAADLLRRAGVYLQEHASYSLAKPLHEEALRIHRHLLGPEHPVVAASLASLGQIALDQGNYAEAEEISREALRIREQQLGPEHPDVAQSLNNLAGLFYEQGKYKEAEALYQRALQIQGPQLGTNHHQVAVSLHNLANISHMRGAYEESASLYRRALAVWEDQLGADHPLVAHPLTNLANIARDLGRLEEAEPLYQRALSIWERHLGADHPLVAQPLTGLGDLFCEQGRLGEAEPLYQRALQVEERQLGPEHVHIAYSLNNLANLFKLQGNFAQSEIFYQRGIHILEQSLGPEHAHGALLLTGLAGLYLRQSAFERAQQLYERALRTIENALGAQHPFLIETLQGLAAVHEAEGTLQTALSLQQRALAILERDFQAPHPKITAAQEHLRRVQAALGAHDEAKQADIL